MHADKPNDAFLAQARAQLAHTFAGLTAPAPHYRGKVRDVYENARGDELVLVATDRVSAFDVVLGTIPFKGQLLTEQATFWLEKARAVTQTHLLERVDPQAMRVKKTRALPVELVVRGYLAGSLLREPKETRGAAYGVRVDPAHPDYGAFETPLVTPTTKEAVGVHDQPCSIADLVASGKLTRAQADRCVEIALALFRMGQAHARAQGLLLVDTKYELGVLGDPASGEIVLIDEVHTADSSRFWRADTYAARTAQGEAPDMLDKERLRRWLIANGFSGNGTPPALSDDVRLDLAAHYAELTGYVTGRPFAPVAGDASARIAGVVRAL